MRNYRGIFLSVLEKKGGERTLKSRFTCWFTLRTPKANNNSFIFKFL